jgi:RNA polymerase sigma factor (sigma-70 family)
MFIRHWNGQGNPVGAVSLMFSQWYTHHRKAKYHSLLRGLQDLNEGELSQMVQETDDGGTHAVVDGVIEVDLTDGIQIQELRTVIHQVLSTQSDRNKVLFLMHLKEHTSSEIALELGIKRQRVDFIIARTLESIKKVLVQ